MKASSATPFVVHRFIPGWKPDPSDPAKLIQHDKVEYGPFSLDGQERVRNIEYVNRLLAINTKLDPGANETARMAMIRADFIRKRYEDWKAGRETPLDGTPLAAWNGLLPEEGDIFRTKGVKTVEQLASLVDHQMAAIPLPNIRAKVEDAKRYVAARDTIRIAGDLAAKDAEIASLRAEQDDSRRQMDEMASMLAELMEEKKRLAVNAAREDAGETKRRPGRPPRVEAQAAA